MDRPIPKATASTGPLSDPGMARDFLDAQANYLWLQLQMAEMAILKSRNAEVRTLARAIHKDYGEVKRQLSRIAALSKWDFKVSHTDHQAMLRHLEGQDEDEFDRAILDLIIETQEEAIAHLRGAYSDTATVVESSGKAVNDTAYSGAHPGTDRNDQNENYGRIPHDKSNVPIAEGDLNGWVDNTLPVYLEYLEYTNRLRERL